MTTLRRSLIAGFAAAVTLFSGASFAADKGPVLVLGGTGQLGSEVVKLLVDKGEAVSVFARSNSKHDLLEGLKVDYVMGDLTNAADVAAAVKSKPFRAVLNTVRVENNDIHFYETIMGNLAAALKGSAVKQFIHQSAVGAGDNAILFSEKLGWEKVPGLLDRLKDQGVGEDILKKSGVGYTIIRNSRIWPAGTPATGKASLTEDQTVMTPMTRTDLAVLTVSCLDNPACMNKIFHIKDETLSWPPPRMQ